MASAETTLRERVQAGFAAEFASEGWTAADDKLTRAAGQSGTVAAVSPETAEEDPRNVLVLVVRCRLQLYLAYVAQPDETIVVDPTVIEGYADRLRRRFAPSATGPSVDDLWYLRLMRVEYPDDPTGNKSRLEAVFEARADNPAAMA